MKRLMLLLLLVPTMLFAYEYTIPYDDTPQVIKTLIGSPVAIYTENSDRVVSIDQYSFLIQQGKCWYVEQVYPIGIGATVDIILDARGMTKTLTAFPTAWATTSGPVKIYLGIATGYTGGTAITPINRFPGADSREVDVVFNATVTGAVMPTYPTILVGTSATNQSSGGGFTSGRLPIVLNNNTLYVFRIVNESGKAISLYSDLIWFEGGLM